MYNHTGLQGRLTATPELRYTPSGTAITSFTLASDTGRKTKDGNRITNFIDCVAWRQQAEFACKYLTKGRLVIVDGELTSRTYEDKDGNRRKATEITVRNINFSDSKKDGQSAGSQPQGDDFADPGCADAPASRRWTAMTAISRFRTTDGRPKADQLRAKDTRPQRGGDDRGMDPSTSDTQRSPQAVRRC